MTRVGVEIKGIPEFNKLMKEVGSLRPFKVGLKAGGFHLKGRIARYPRVSRRPQPFVSDKQRRGFFAKLKSGEIEVPYRRGISKGSERHNQSWTVKGRKSGLEQIVGSDTTYGRLLQDAKKQTAYHQGTGWITIQQTAKKEQAPVSKVVLVAMNKAIRKIKGR